MYYIIETQEQLEKFRQYDLSECIVDIVPYNDQYHPVLSSISLVYLRPFRSKSGFILALDHSETFKVLYNDVKDLIQDSIGKLYAVDYKRLKYYFNRRKNTYCLKTAYYLKEGKGLSESDYDTTAHRFFHQRYGDLENINRLIPISKHYEKLENLSSVLKKYVKGVEERYYSIYGNTAVSVFFAIENKGLKLSLGGSNNYYSFKTPAASLRQDTVYTQYNIYTATARPSNSFNGINFSALSKENDARKYIQPKNDYLVEFDYSSYHLRILCKIINYTFEDTDIHRHIGKYYYEKDILTEEEYQESKRLTFRLLYTDNDIEEVKNIEFFSKVKELKETLWKKYKKDGYINSFYSGRPIKNIDSKTQILPYILQSYETERNIEVMQKILYYLKDKTTKLVLYCYDSFLFDFSKKDGSTVLGAINEILEEDYYKTSCKYGKNYKELETI